MSIFVQYAPYHLREGTWPEKREALAHVTYLKTDRREAERRYAVYEQLSKVVVSKAVAHTVSKGKEA